MYLKYKHMQIVKHALQYYVQREQERLAQELDQ